MATVLITGGSGLIGTALTAALLAQDHEVRHLSRAHKRAGPFRTFLWDIDSGTMDGEALFEVDHIIHLAGAGIADKRWTAPRVHELIRSRTESARLLLRTARDQNVHVKSFISAAGINFYGSITTDHLFVENDAAAKDTIGTISRVWEEAVDEWSPYTRVAKLRTPVVLSPSGGALQKLVAPVRWGAAAALGSGKQWMPWIHVEDLVRIYVEAIANDRFVGAYNVNTGADVTNDEFMRTAARVLGRPFFLPNVPGFLLKAALGELSSVLLEGSRASNKKLLDTGFTFRYPTLEGALRALLK